MFEYVPSFIPYKFFVFGCGGTGSRLVPLAAQFIKSCDWLKPFSPEMVLIDPDIVEEKNLSRQNFIKRDINKGKAVVLAERYSKGFDIPIKAFFGKVSIHEKREVKEDFLDLSRHPLENYEGENPYTNFNNSIIFLCVDSIAARQSIIEFIQHCAYETSNCIVIDTGNENDFGQVKVMGSHYPHLMSSERAHYMDIINSLPTQVPIKHSLSKLPWDLAYFTDMVPPTETRSCADLDQTMAINCMVANTAFSVLQNILERNPIAAHRYNISLQHGIQPEYITWKYLDSLRRNNLLPRMNLMKPFMKLHEELEEKFPFLLKQPEAVADEEA